MTTMTPEIPVRDRIEHGTPQSGLVEIPASAALVWDAISTKGGLPNYHPFCRENPVDNWPGEGARDHVIYFSGLRYQRDFLCWHEGIGYDLELGPRPPEKSAHVSWRITPKAKDSSSLSITVTPYLRSDFNAAQKAKYETRFFGNTIASYLDAVVMGVACYVTTEIPVREDQFGSHPIYSRML